MDPPLPADKDRPTPITHVVASHYNARPELGVDARKQSNVLQLRKFNNWVKSVLINQYTRGGHHALDLGCGKGGDLIKWNQVRIRELVGLDIAKVSIEQARQRYQSLKRANFQATFHAVDCYQESITPYLPSGFMADVVSMQFCMHYAFDCEEHVRTMLQNVSRHLKPGGHFIGTIPNANFLVKRIRSIPDNQFGNSIYRVEFDSKDPFALFGHCYRFTLRDAVDDCPEYLVHFKTFVAMAAEYGLQLLENRPFHEFYAHHMNNPRAVELIHRMQVVSPQHPELSAEEWEVAGLYLAFAFKKRDN
ncbi:mRNA cap guanine-N7 methyltransferase [Dispira parvispora]|uniref:mRNA cap guanine-N(7) methyltransferase n=1 Tax=Dispira parvispora TaxID=1520584 RepID=A0A9W8E3K8_9FUNG|nr:mRNA cap guanine-N7 methyltransferase [Dispira parvispora]